MSTDISERRPDPRRSEPKAPAMLRIAVPNKGSLADTAAEMLSEAGYAGRRDPKDLHIIDPHNEVEFFYLRPKDIATYVGSGALDVGITGRDLLLDARMPGAREIEALGFAASTFRFAAPAGRFADVTDLEGVRIATSYPGLVDRFLDEHDVAADLVPLDGAVESAVRLGVADAIADVVETGTTLRQAGLEIFGPVILRSEAVLIGAPIEVDGNRDAAAAAARRHGRPQLRPHRLRSAGRSRRRGGLDRSRHRVADDLTAAGSFVGGRAGDEPPQGRQPGHGRALRDRRSSDPGECHPQCEALMSLVCRVIPCLDVAGGRVVKGVNFANLRDMGDPVELARLYFDQGADEITFLDVTATVDERSTTYDVVRRTAEEVFIPLTVGGGVRSADDVARLLSVGADKIGVNSAAIARPALVDEIADRFGAQVLVLSLDVKRVSTPSEQTPSGFVVTTHGGRTETTLDALAWAREAIERGAGELLVNSIDADGTREGFDLELVSLMREISSVPVIASGGAGSVEHFPPAIRAGADAVLAASVFHSGQLTVGEVKSALIRDGIEVRETGLVRSDAGSGRSEPK